jgi:deazaflavin-dependent oxidoreductase (nitroreductase family)
MTGRYYRPPTWVRVRLVNPLLRALVLRAGLGRRGDQNLMRVLRVQGRRSGRLYEVPMRIATWDGQRYIVSLQGDSQWARNLRAAGTAQLLVGTSVEPVVAREIQAEEKAAFLAWYCQQPDHQLSVRYGLKADTANLTPAEVDRLARQYPVFRLEPAGTPRRGKQEDASSVGIPVVGGSTHTNQRGTSSSC